MSSVILKYKGNEKKLDAGENETLLEVLRRNGVLLPAPCGGNGKCGKCRVSIVRGGVSETVLACKTAAENGMAVFASETDALICDDFDAAETYTADGTGFGIAVDLGTTTVAAALTELSTGRVISRTSAMNEQAAYGADVISRTQYTIDRADGLDELSGTIVRQINKMADELCGKAGVRRDKIFVAGNTIMQHIYAHLPPKSIAVAPFTPVTLFENGGEGEAELSPCVSGYIGGDITAGMLAVGLHKAKNPCLFIDLGTNGEMALGSAEGIVCCSVASGPAFEGAGISCGMASTCGAINHISYSDGEFHYSTIGDAPAVGICGSGIIELTACLLKLGIIDGSGYLQPPEDVDGDFGESLGEDEDGNGIVYITKDESVFFTARDVRQIQLAKAAVAAGIEILMQEAGSAPDDIERLYLAGGFGTYIDVESAAEIGMLPTALREKVKSVGNSSLAGAVLAISSAAAREELFKIPSLCRYTELSGDKRFNEYFADNMAFYED